MTIPRTHVVASARLKLPSGARRSAKTPCGSRRQGKPGMGTSGRRVARGAEPWASGRSALPRAVCTTAARSTKRRTGTVATGWSALTGSKPEMTWKELSSPPVLTSGGSSRAVGDIGAPDGRGDRGDDAGDDDKAVVEDLLRDLTKKSNNRRWADHERETLKEILFAGLEHWICLESEPTMDEDGDPWFRLKVEGMEPINEKWTNTPPAIPMYHGTSPEAVKLILKRKRLVVTMGCEQNFEGIYLARDLRTATRYTPGVGVRCVVEVLTASYDKVSSNVYVAKQPEAVSVQAVLVGLSRGDKPLAYHTPPPGGWVLEMLPGGIEAGLASHPIHRIDSKGSCSRSCFEYALNASRSNAYKELERHRSTSPQGPSRPNAFKERQLLSDLASEVQVSRSESEIQDASAISRTFKVAPRRWVQRCAHSFRVRGPRRKVKGHCSASRSNAYKKQVRLRSRSRWFHAYGHSFRVRSPRRRCNVKGHGVASRSPRVPKVKDADFAHPAQVLGECWSLES